MLSEVVFNHGISSSSSSASLPPKVAPPTSELSNLTLINAYPVAPSCSAAAAAALMNSTSSTSSTPSNVLSSVASPDECNSTQLTGSASTTGVHLPPHVKPKRSKFRPKLRIALSSSLQAPGSSPMSPSTGVHGGGSSFDGCLPLSPSLQKQLLQKSDPQLSATALDEPKPVEIIPKLYIGTIKSASDRALLERLNIGYIINVTTNLPNFFEDRSPNDFQYFRIPLEDHWSGDIAQYIDEAITFINTARRSDRTCLVHCLAGRSRSVAIVIAYIMYTSACTLDEAYELVKKRKPGVAPGLHFLRQLQDFQERFSVSKKGTLQTANSCDSSSSGPYSDESSGCSTPLSLFSFDQVDQTNSGSITFGGSRQFISNEVTSTKSSVDNDEAVVSGSSVSLSDSVRSRDRNTCPSVPSVDSAFTDDQVPPVPTSSQSFKVISGSETLSG